MSSFKESIRRLGEKLFPKIETPAALAAELAKKVKAISVLIEGLDEAALQQKCIDSETGVNAATFFALNKFFIITREYAVNPECRQSVQVRAILEVFILKYRAAILKDLPVLLEAFCQQLAEIEQLDQKSKRNSS